MQLGHERVQGDAPSPAATRCCSPASTSRSPASARASAARTGSSPRSTCYGTRGYVTQLTLGAGGRPLAGDDGSGGRARSFADHLVDRHRHRQQGPRQARAREGQYPLLNDEVESGWARIAWGAAGKERGTVTLPHVNDEVAIGFEHGDVRRPVILGALFNGVDKPGADLVKDDELARRALPARPRRRDEEEGPADERRGHHGQEREGPVRASRAGKDMKLTPARQERHDHDRDDRRQDQGDGQAGRRDQRQRPAEDHVDGAA